MRGIIGIGLVMVGFLAGGCGSSKVAGEPDAAGSLDGGLGVDGGPVADGGAEVDGGPGADGGPGGDGGPTGDAGPCALIPRPDGCTCSAHLECASGRCVNFVCATAVGFCLNVGTPCAVSSDCCSGRCEPDIRGVRICQQGTGACKGMGEPCLRAADCCSLYCRPLGDGGGGGACDTGQLCEPAGDPCQSDIECCTNVCSTTCQSISLPSGPFGPATNCLSAGEVCNPAVSGGGCCSRNCTFVGGEHTFRCAFSANCKAEGEVCGASTECCNGVCQFCLPGGGCADTPLDAGTYIGRCIVTTGCKVAGQPCASAGECCSRLCADNGLGAPTCQFLGGCRPACEICTEDWQCCASIGGFPMRCLPADAPGGGCGSGYGFKRCNLIEGPRSPGEVCGAGSPTGGCGILPVRPNQHLTLCDDCCQPAIADLYRCCLHGALADGGCICVGEGEACASPADCCSGFCFPAPSLDGGITAFRCGGCRLEGQSCSSNGDCCSGNCVEGEGGLVCGPAICIGSQLGGPCNESIPCCSGRCLNGRCASCIPRGESCAQDPNACCEGICVSVDGSSICEACQVTGSCTVNAQCCSGACVAGQCRSCGAMGDSCGDGGLGCCPGLPCDNGRCASCIATGSPTQCASNRDCCSGRCVSGSCAPCAVDGQPCTVGGDCCSGRCEPGPDGGLACTSCGVIGAVCQVNGDCCSGRCVGGDGGGTCQLCVPTRSPCAQNSDCCSNLCVNGLCNVP
jgi:hypothetical protein